MSDGPSVLPFRSPSEKPRGSRWRAANLEAYWDGLRDGRIVPDRDDVHARGISHILSHAFLLEQLSPELARMRIVGQYFNQLMGMEVRGMPLSALFTPDARGELGRSLKAVFEEPARVDLDLLSDAGFRRREMKAKMLLLPLRDACGEITRAIGVIESDDDIGRVPRRFRVSGVTRKTLIGFGNRRETDLADAARAFAEKAPVFTHKEQQGPDDNARVKRTVPYLRLVKTDTD